MTFQGHPVHMLCEEGERVCCLILTLAEGTGGNFPFFLGLNLPIKSTPQNLAYSAILLVLQKPRTSVLSTI